jgi:PAS domain-containing protein
MATPLLTGGGRSRAGILAVVGLLAVGIGACLLVLNFIRGERERELSQWQLRLDWRARQASAALDDWLDQQDRLAGRLAANDTVRLHLTLQDASAAGLEGTPAPAPEDLSYVRNLLQAVALNAGLRLLDTAQRVPANVAQFAPEGVALVDSGGRGVAATSGMPQLTEQIRALLAERQPGQSLIAGLEPHQDDPVRVLVVRPVFRFQAEESAEEETGAIVLLRALSRQAAAALMDRGQPAAPGSDSEVLYLLSRTGDSGRLLLSSAERGRPGIVAGATFSLDNQGYFLAQAARDPGHFLKTQAPDGQALLLASASLQSLPWVSVATADRGAALEASEARLDTLSALFFGGIAIAILLILLFWRHGASAKAAALSARMAESLRQEQRAHTLLQGVSDAMTDELLALDGAGRLLYANRCLADRLGVRAADLKGKSLAAALGPAAAEPLEEGLAVAHADGETVERELTLEEAGEERVIRAVFVPVGPLGDSPEGEAAPASIIVAQDITEPLRSREALAEAQRRLVQALVRVINQRDPFAAEQSAKASALARELAEAMELPAAEVEAAAQAALLVDLGKVQIPRSILTKHGPLTLDELSLVRQAVREGPALVEEAGLPPIVLQTLKQLAAGLGAEDRPVDMRDDDLLTATKVAALAHQFVALASKRGHREGFPLEEALKIVGADTGIKHDDAVLAALAHLYYSGGGRERWARP